MLKGHTLAYWAKSNSSIGLGECSCKEWRARGTKREVQDAHARHLYKLVPKRGDSEPEGSQKVPQASRS